MIGLGVAGASAARRLDQRGWSVVVGEDRPTDATRVRGAGLDVVESPQSDIHKK